MPPAARSWWRVLRIVLVVVLLLAAAWLGLTEGPDAWRDAGTTGQRVAAATQISYGVAALVSLAGLFRGARWLPIALGAWAAALCLTAGLAAVVWGGAGWTGGLAAGAGTLVVALLVARGAVAHAAGKRSSGKA